MLLINAKKRSNTTTDTKESHSIHMQEYNYVHVGKWWKYQ